MVRPILQKSKLRLRGQIIPWEAAEVVFLIPKLLPIQPQALPPPPVTWGCGPLQFPLHSRHLLADESNSPGIPKPRHVAAHADGERALPALILLVGGKRLATEAGPSTQASQALEPSGAVLPLHHPAHCSADPAAYLCSHGFSPALHSERPLAHRGPQRTPRARPASPGLGALIHPAT